MTTTNICPTCGCNSASLERKAHDRLIRERDELIAALERAVEIIRLWQGMGMSKDVEPGMWKLYQSSPEMKQINAALQRVKGNP